MSLAIFALFLLMFLASLGFKSGRGHLRRRVRRAAGVIAANGGPVASA